jgi:transposase
VHSRYERTLADGAAAGRQVVLRLRVRRFFCDSADCRLTTFVEQVDGLTVRHARRTPLARSMLETIGLALAGRAGCRLAAALGLPTSRSTLLRLVRALPDPQVGTVTTLGVDDFAFKRGHVYGTILINMESGRPVDVLDDREADTFAAWLRAHPGVQIVCRDRAGAYADGARQGAPDAIQVADRWHLWHNLAGHVEKTVASHTKCLKDKPPDPEQPDPNPDAHQDDAQATVRDAGQAAAQVAADRAEGSALAVRTRERYAAVHALLAQGKGIKAIVRELGLARETVRRFARAGDVEQLLATCRDGRPSILDDYKAHLHRRWNDGVTCATRLYEEIKDQGYPGSRSTVADYLRPLRDGTAAPPPTPRPPKVREITSWILTHPDRLDADDQAKLDQVTAACPHLDAAAGHVATFAAMLTGLHGDRLDDWIAAVDADDLPHLHSFTTGLKRDHAAVLNGLTLTHNSGAVEGNVNRIKMIKRQMYGRANPDLLRKRVLLAA